MTSWDEKHRQAAEQESPVPLVTEFAARMTPGRALDLACGTGRNALWLAANRWQVTAVDLSQVAIDRVLERAARNGARVAAQVADLERHEFAIKPEQITPEQIKPEQITPEQIKPEQTTVRQWDLIVIWNYLQRDLYPAAKAALAPGGLIIASALLGNAAQQKFRVDPGELKSYFADCEILHYQEIEGQDQELDWTRHRRAELVARKR